jgi:HK97 family phage major capsid protein
MWIKLIRSIPKTNYVKDEVVEVEDAIGAAYIERGYAEEARGPELVEGALDAETRAEIDGLKRAFTETLQLIRAQIRSTNEELRPHVQVEAGEAEDDKLVRTCHGGFRSMGHFAYAINRGFKPDNPDPTHHASLVKYRDAYDRIARAASGMNEASDPDGGLAIPPTFSTQIWERTRDYYNIADQITLMPIGGNSWQMPADAETSRVDGSRRGGIQAFWEGEAAQYQKSKPTFSDRYLRLKKLTALVYVTNEQLDDAPGLEGYLNRVAPEEITFKINDALVNGTGVGMPFGMVKHPSRVTVNKESGQASATIVANNFLKMWARLYAPSRRNAVILINQDVEPQLQQMAIATGTSSGQLIYMPPTGLSQSPYATLNGRPVIPIEQCATVGTEGDIIITDLTQMLGIRKAVGLQQSMSIHLRFDFDETVFKFSMRMDAQPAWEKPLTPFKGTNTQGTIITLQTR